MSTPKPPHLVHLQNQLFDPEFMEKLHRVTREVVREGKKKKAAEKRAEIEQDTQPSSTKPSPTRRI